MSGAGRRAIGLVVGRELSLVAAALVACFQVQCSGKRFEAAAEVSSKEAISSAAPDVSSGNSGPVKPLQTSVSEVVNPGPGNSEVGGSAGTEAPVASVLPSGGASLSDAGTPALPVSHVMPLASVSGSSSAAPGTGSASAAASTQPPKHCSGDREELGPNGACYFFARRSLTWDEAVTFCAARGDGWVLSDVRSKDEHEFLAGRLNAEMWIGGRLLAPTEAQRVQRWAWLVDGIEFWRGDASGSAVKGAFTFWGLGEPDNTQVWEGNGPGSGGPWMGEPGGATGSGENCLRYRQVNGEWAWASGNCEETYQAVCLIR
jgi:hypothetical protein